MNDETIYQAYSSSQIKSKAPSFHNNRRLKQKIDALPTGPVWIHEYLKVKTGMNQNDEPTYTEVQLWRRDAVECVRELIGDPTFDGHIAYGPEMTFADKECTNRQYGEMWQGEHWWDLQVSNPVH